MTALDELRQALAEWDRLTEAATPGPWCREEVALGDTEAVLAPHPSIPRDATWRVAEDAIGADAAFIVAAVGLAPTVRAILADAINEPDESYDWTIYDATALRLARSINQPSSSDNRSS